MPLKANESNSTLSSSGSSGDQVVVVANMRGSNPVPRKTQPPVVIHNQGGQIYDETRPSDWDKQRWK
ncbi:hypothetical protein P175DRAFT_0427161 [Aspergillus ochraceoroseus IBT 24754]|uniref:Uncharacterized protein n=3 Tax=Aspergillus subgen. Nidulantes TaxID=2720870 RepID=A0A0F8V688_9EURO|nr:uncharacterized protein P175DRAFT_0427161 [Aspergillus ochraceoroseus IBT 24754]KKK18501.1 hypothetical protein ARAM_007016 [Aspergillus rambellii]KKK20393.1 hypothetical protein AOCH_005456 [Aspergillus ochraceoroseus]PTU25013.1 hypothetical protein P175DRAFT_0427161 [Aspergillus ochraceoroseus IBT 24754]